MRSFAATALAAALAVGGAGCEGRPPSPEGGTQPGNGNNLQPGADQPAGGQQAPVQPGQQPGGNLTPGQRGEAPGTGNAPGTLPEGQGALPESGKGSGAPGPLPASSGEPQPSPSFLPPRDDVPTSEKEKDPDPFGSNPGFSEPGLPAADSGGKSALEFEEPGTGESGADAEGDN